MELDKNVKATEVPGIYSEKEASKDVQAGFNGNLGLSAYQGSHVMSADVDKVLK